MNDEKVGLTVTAEEQEAVAKELQGRVEEFNKELIPLLQKYELGLGASAFLQPDGRIGARPIMFDDRMKAEGKPQELPSQDAVPPSEDSVTAG